MPWLDVDSRSSKISLARPKGSSLICIHTFCTFDFKSITAEDSASKFTQLLKVNCLAASSHFCCLLTNFANSLDPDQARQFVGPDLDPYCLTLG